MIPHLTPKDKNLIFFIHSQEINIDGRNPQHGLLAEVVIFGTPARIDEFKR
jgi:hypothetical protein